MPSWTCQNQAQPSNTKLNLAKPGLNQKNEINLEKPILVFQNQPEHEIKFTKSGALNVSICHKRGKLNLGRCLGNFGKLWESTGRAQCGSGVLWGSSGRPGKLWSFPYQGSCLVRKIKISLPNQASGKEIFISLPDSRFGKEIFIFFTKRLVWCGNLELPYRMAGLVRKSVCFLTKQPLW